jgi:hypothetical protein
MRDWFQRMFSPSEEPSQDIQFWVKATLKARARRRKYRRQRRRLMAKVRARAAGSRLGLGRKPEPVVSMSLWKEHSA